MKTECELPVFERKFWNPDAPVTRIGTGTIGGKATGLVFIRDFLKPISTSEFPGVEIGVPVMAVVATDCFDKFVQQNRLRELPFDELRDDLIAEHFLKADIPVDMLGDLRALIEQVQSPLAIRSSSLLEDALDRPFAGVYATKMIPNNQFSPDMRFRKLTEAIKFVWASTFFKGAREYIRTTGNRPEEEKMAVIIQEVVGRRHGDRFYPDISGVGRSYNFYPIAGARPEEGVANLALGLGKTIVDGGISWTFVPTQPKRSAPFESAAAMLDGTQRDFWAVNMGPAPAYDPTKETEYLAQCSLQDAEADEALRFSASTFDAQRDRIVPGLYSRGPRVLDFAPVLVRQEIPVPAIINTLLQVAEAATKAKVEIEFAITIEERREEAPHVKLGFLQVRPMVVSDEVVEISDAEMTAPETIVASERAMGNGTCSEICDIVYVKPETFAAMRTREIAAHLSEINAKLLAENRPYLLIGFGRWGSSQPTLGIPVEWSDISGARSIVESTLPQINVELSQGSHFFHNLTSFRASYLMVRHDEPAIRWEWLAAQAVVTETELVRHVRVSSPITVRVDGRCARAIIQSAK